jgi:hypothetical protein
LVSIPIKSVIRAHLENAADLAVMMRGASFSLKPVSWFETLCQRCEANLDGLRIAGEYSIGFAQELLADQPEIATILAILLAECAGEQPASAQQAIALLDHPSSEVRDWAWWGLRLAPCRHIAPELAKRALGSKPVDACVAMDILAFHRIPIARPGRIAQPDDEAAWFFVEAAGRSNIPWTTDDLRHFASHPTRPVRQAAWRASARRAAPGLLAFCRDAATRTDSIAAEALEFLGVVGSREDLDLLRIAVSHQQTAHAALSGIGRLGSPQSVPFLLEALTEPSLCESAAAVLERITGTKVTRGALPTAPASMTEDELDVWEPIAPIDALAAREWWSATAGRFNPDKQWQGGLCMSDQPLRDEVFDHLPLGIRYDIYLRERALAAGTPDWELETWIGKRKKPQIEMQGSN